MSVVIVSPFNGKYLNQVRGSRRGQTSDLTEAQVFPSVGKAKIAYNHLYSQYVRMNNHNRSLLERFPHRTDIKLIDIPAFCTQEVSVVTTGPVVNHG